MRKIKHKAHEGDFRVKEGFLWLPKTLPLPETTANGSYRPSSRLHETRWLEKAVWIQEYRGDGHVTFGRWEDVRWTSDPRIPKRAKTTKHHDIGEPWETYRNSWGQLQRRPKRKDV